MTAYYPSNIRNNFSVKQNFINTVENVDVNDLQDEITAVETYLGSNPHISAGWSGSFTTSTTTWASLAARVQNIEYGLNSAINETVAASGLTGTTLSSTVVTSSLTSVGTLTNLTVSGTTTSGHLIGEGSQITNLTSSSLGVMHLMGAL